MDTASPSLLSIMRRDACVRIKSKKFYSAHNPCEGVLQYGTIDSEG